MNESTANETDPGADGGQSEFGPGGYLPPRAAKRARKIVLREQMGVHWPIAAVVAGVLILVITIPLVLLAQRPPADPFVASVSIDAVDPSGDGLVDVDGVEVLVVRAGGVLRAFTDPPNDARFCPASRRIESTTGQVWTAEGRLIAGEGESLPRADIQAYEGTLYIDVVTPDTPLPPLLGDQTPAC